MVELTSQSLGPRPYWQYLLFAFLVAIVWWAAPPARLLALLAFGFIAVVIVGRIFKLDRWLVSLTLLESPPPQASSSGLILWPCMGFSGVVIALGLLEWRQPYYFTQDENLAQYLPTVLHGTRSFFAGAFPTWNPYQFLGSPTASVGWYAFTYPVTYLAYWIARSILHHEYATLDVFAWLHLLLGYWATYWVARREQVRPWLAALASASFVLSGFALLSSRSWFQISSIFLWTPLLMLGVQQLPHRNIGWKWILFFGTVLGIFYHAGHVQMWAYAILLIDFAVLLLAVSKAIGGRELLAVLSAHVVALAIACPLLIPQLTATRNVIRIPESAGIGIGLAGLFLPDSLVRLPHPLGWGSYPIGEMYYTGTLFVIVSALLLVSLLTIRWNKQSLIGNVWFASALLAFVLALGTQGLLWTGLGLLPGFDRFRWAYKFLGYLALFTCIAGATALERLIRNRRWSLSPQMVILALSVCLLGYHCSLCTAAYYNYAFAPFPKLDPRLESFLRSSADRSEKILPLGSNRSHDPNFPNSMKNQWPTQYRVFSMWGADGMVMDAPDVRRMVQRVSDDFAHFLPEYGVRYILKYTSQDDFSFQAPLAFDVVYRSDVVTLYEVPDPRPIAYAEAKPDSALPVKFDAHGAEITTSALYRGGPLILNMLWRPEFVATGDHGAMLVAGPDALERIRIEVPPGCETVRLDFVPPWRFALLVTAVLLLLATLPGWLSQRR